MPSNPGDNQENEPPKAYQPLTLKEVQNETEPKNLRTPVKSLAQGLYFNAHQYTTTPTTRPHVGLLSGASSPQLHTPKSGSVSRTANLSRQRLNSEDSTGSAKSTPLFSTPGGTKHRVVRNPFDSPGQVAQLHDHVFSPDCFRKTAPDSAEKTPRQFRWSIDQIALLNPADIEEMPIQQDTLNIRKDKRTEAMLQKKLDNYFREKDVVPSPMHHPPPKHVLPQTPGSKNSPMLDYLRETGKYCNEPEKKTQQDAACQTALSLPVNFDLEKILGKEHYKKVEVDGDSSMRSDTGAAASTPAAADTSSLRRKLFFHGDEGTPLSPVRQQRHSMEDRFMHHGPDSPTDAQFASSPIRPNELTPLRRCSTAPNLDAMDSPFLSPIIHDDSPPVAPVRENVINKPVKNKQVKNKSVKKELFKDICGPMQGTPSPGENIRPPTRRSLAMSPIHDNSYREQSYRDEHMVSLHHSQSTRPSFNISPAPTTSSDSPRLSPSQSIFSQHRFGKPLGDLDDGVSFLSECDPASSQDTGYNTELGTHTNLTTQFGTLLETVPKPSSDLFTMGQDNDNDNACFEVPVSLQQGFGQVLGQRHQGLGQGHQGLGQGYQGPGQGINQGFGQGISQSNTQGIRPQRQQRLSSLSRQMSEPVFHLNPSLSLQSSLNSSNDDPSGLMQSLPESLLGASIPISISRTSSVAYELSNEQQVLNESSPPSVNTTPIIPQRDILRDAEGEVVQKSDDVVIRRARRALGMDSPMDQGTPAASRTLPGGVDWYVQGTDTPNRQKITGMARTLERRRHDVNNMLPSEMAYEVIKKAGMDYNKVVSGEQLEDTCHYEDADHADMSFTN